MKLFDIWAQVPEDYFDKGVKRNLLQRIWHTGKLQAVARAIGHSSTGTLVDIGSADGSFMHRLTNQGITMRSIIAIDPYLASLLYGRRHFKSLHFLQADTHKLPVKSNCVDVVTICETLEHVVDPYCTIRELRRIVKKNGAIVVEMDSGNTLFQIVWFFWKKFGGGKVWNNAHLTFFNVHLLEQLFGNAGLIIEKKDFFNAGMGVCFVLKKT